MSEKLQGSNPFVKMLANTVPEVDEGSFHTSIPVMPSDAIEGVTYSIIETAYGVRWHQILNAVAHGALMPELIPVPNDTDTVQNLSQDVNK